MTACCNRDLNTFMYVSVEYDAVVNKLTIY